MALSFCAGGCQLAVDVDRYSFASEPEAAVGQEIGSSAPSADSADAGGSASSFEALAVCMGDVTMAICEGTWRYRRWASCTVSDAGPVTPSTCSSTPACATWQTCEDWSFGTGAPLTEVATYQHQVTTCRNRSCFNACVEEATGIQAAADALRAAVPAQFQDQVIIVQEAEAVISSRRYSPGFLEDDKFDEIRECTVTFEYPTPASGQGAVCGCATFDCPSPGCGPDPNELTSPAGLTLEALRAQDPDVADTPAPSCSACDALPLDGPGAAPEPF